ncbi:putative exported protein [Polaromonas sp. CG9_12]|uniref:DUF305 domain-containing protein n=1 Tax=Polaromonas sp. CG_9.11 TaxID=2787730 RepID=UPI0004DDD686|nr:DUF305 domain-containing protein [Polaromonas sp. CG_9.11]MBG6076430.1 uncharacterized protein (DUF305 family) [Polaromonas sp. CG_9.11]CDS50649.1 putative exported protein [Polaromonas sp. CG9_12]
MNGAARIRTRLTLAVAMALLACSAAAQQASGHGQAAMQADSASRFQADMDAGMARMMQDMHALDYSGNADADFLAMMIPHHAGAVDMARLLLRHGRDPATRQLAEEIMAGQTIEIESMTRRLAALRQPASASPRPEFPSLGGNRGN